MSRLEDLGPETWEAFVEAPVAVLVIGTSDCAACRAWSDELTTFLEAGDWTEVRFGKLLLDRPGLGAFKKAHPWVAGIQDLPTNVIFVAGERHKTFAGGGAARLERRLERVMTDRA